MLLNVLMTCFPFLSRGDTTGERLEDLRGDTPGEQRENEKCHVYSW